mmetsp:Transcript_41786/g.99114  ORF Transcript_41786/g.99114 Transcript_41786/m.99114 type:complete len:331 (-) Transcript_41786:231-1223(-)
MGWLSWFLNDSAGIDCCVDPAKPPRFKNLDAEAKSYLESEGYVVISVLDENEVQEARLLFWDFWEQLDHHVSRSDPMSWGRLDDFIHKDTGIINSYGIGQSRLLWYLRGLPAVRAVFQELWETDDIITSFDGAGLFRPWNIDPAWKTNGGWFHVDQSPRRKGRACVQGLVTLYDQDTSTGGLVVVPGSHRHHQALCRSTATGVVLGFAGTDFIPVPSRSFASRGLRPRLVDCRAGDIVLWDSRTVHCNCPAAEPPPPPGPDEGPQMLRAVAYICMVPRTWATEEALQRRRACFEMRETTTHWPHEPRVPSSRAIPGDNGFELSEEQAALV